MMMMMEKSPGRGKRLFKIDLSFNFMTRERERKADDREKYGGKKGPEEERNVNNTP